MEQGVHDPIAPLLDELLEQLQLGPQVGQLLDAAVRDSAFLADWGLLIPQGP